MSNDTEAEVTATDPATPPTPKPAKPRKPAAKQAKVKAKPAKAAKPAAKPAKVKAKGNGKAKVKAKAKAKRAPRTVDPAKLDQFGFRLNSLKSRAATMYAGKKGATLAEVKEALDSTQFNLLTELEEKGFKVERTEAAGKSGRQVTRFHISPK